MRCIVCHGLLELAIQERVTHLIIYNRMRFESAFIVLLQNDIYQQLDYNSVSPQLIRFFNEDRFEIYAARDIKEGEELTHTYRSLRWRKCFKPVAQALGVATESAPKSIKVRSG